ncbi:hypothetical protein ABPG75_008401 [Micractinium tetrahymenae]
MADTSEATVLADLAALKLEQGDADGAQKLFRQALEQQQQGGDAGGAVAAAAAAADEDNWEAWDEASVPVAGAAPQKPADAADSWESSAAAQPAARRSSRSAPCGAAAAAPTSSGGGAEDEGELQFGGGHVLEFYDLTPAVRTQHLEGFLERHARGHKAPPTLRWVDDYHAAVICCDPAAARQLLASAAKACGAAEYKLRGYADAGSGTRKLAASELLPPKPRPKTSAAVARRLIGGALNMKLRDRDAEQQLSAARRQQREQRAEREKALDAAWDG